jgi:Ca2+-binding RTX toxin-like protein
MASFRNPSGLEHGVSPYHIVYGTSGADFLWGDDSGLSQRDELYGEGGNDRLKGYGGEDRLDGGAGIDTVYYGDATVGVSVNLATGRGYDGSVGYNGSAGYDDLISIENVFGSYHNDTITGNDASNELHGLIGNDVLKGGGGADGLAGDDGEDILKGGGGADYLEGGYGVDTADYSQAPMSYTDGNLGVYVDLSANGAFWGDAQGDTFSGIENVTGSAYNDYLTGTDGNNALRGLAGDDRIWGLGGDDTLDGGAGVDTMFGGLGSDTYFVDNVADSITELASQGSDEVRVDVSWTLTAGADVETMRTTDDAGLAAINLTGNASSNVVRGNAGNNILNGGDGRDFLTGLGGQDAFLFNTALNGASNVDIVTDFNVADDTIWLDQTIFSSSLTPGNSVAGSQFVIGSAALDAGDRIIYNNATGAVLYDSDGTGATAAVQFAQLSAGLPLTNFDFFVFGLSPAPFFLA